MKEVTFRSGKILFGLGISKGMELCTIKTVVSIINASMLFFLILYVSVTIPAFDKGFYEKQFAANHTAEEIGVSQEELWHVTKYLLDYIQDKQQDLSVEATVDGVQRPFYNEREIAHMADVKVLFQKGDAIRNGAIVVFVLSLGYLVGKRISPKYVAKVYGGTFIGALLLTVAFGGLIATDFEKYFILFHEIFFNNDLWLLDPRTSLLIQLVPLPFFMAMVKMILTIFSICIVTVMGISGFVYRKCN